MLGGARNLLGRVGRGIRNIVAGARGAARSAGT